MKKDTKYAATGVVLVLAGIGGWLLWQLLQEPALPAGLASGNGRIEAVQIDISTKIAGRVETISAKEGDLVEPGQAIAKIDTDQLQAQPLRAEADIASAQSQVAAARASIAQANAERILAEQELSRARELVKKGHTSEETFASRSNGWRYAPVSLPSFQLQFEHADPSKRHLPLSAISLPSTEPTISGNR